MVEKIVSINEIKRYFLQTTFVQIFLKNLFNRSHTNEFAIPK